MESLAFKQFTMFLCLYFGYALYTLNRKSFSFATPGIILSEGLTKGDLGMVVSSQSLAYAIAKFCVGMLSDNLSSKQLFSTGLLLSGIVTISLTACSSVHMFAFLSFLHGLALGFGWPPCAKILKKWYSPAQFGTLWGVMSSSMNFAGFVGPVMTAYLILHFDWKTSLQWAGLLAVIYSIVCVLVLRDSPADVGYEEFGKIQTGSSKRTSGDEDATVKDLVKNPFLWVLFVAYMVVFATKCCLQDWGQLYLIQERSQSPLIGSAFTSSMEFGGLMGNFLVGFISDRLIAVFHNPARTRISVLLLHIAVGAVFIYLLISTVTENSSKLWICFLGFFLGISVYGPAALYGVLAVENSPSHLSGSANALVALGANVGGVMAGLPLSLLAKSYDWSGALVCVNICIVAVCILHFVTLNMNTKVLVKEKTL